jgi:hypothetical protein
MPTSIDAPGDLPLSAGFLNGRAHLGALLKEAYGVTVAWTLPAHDVSGTAFRWNENSMPFRAETAVIWDADGLRMSRGGR